MWKMRPTVLEEQRGFGVRPDSFVFVSDPQESAIRPVSERLGRQRVRGVIVAGGRAIVQNLRRAKERTGLGRIGAHYTPDIIGLPLLGSERHITGRQRARIAATGLESSGIGLAEVTQQSTQH
jgi:hypothetical protein